MPVIVSITRHIFSYPFFFTVVQPLVAKMSIVEFIKQRHAKMDDGCHCPPHWVRDIPKIK